MSVAGPIDFHTENASLALQGMIKNTDVALGIEELHYAAVTVK